MAYHLKNHANVAHYWANNAQERGTAGNVSFANRVLFSYSTAIGELTETADGRTVAVLNATSYSHSTAKHQYLARRALASDIPRLFVYGAARGTQRLAPEDFERASRRIPSWLKETHERLAVAALARAVKARTNGEYYRAEAANYLQALADYAKAFNLDYTAPAGLELDKLVAAQQHQRKLQAQALREAKAKRIAEQAEQLEKWRKGENVYRRFEATALRIKGDNVETSHGANIPVADAIRVWPLLKRWHEVGVKYPVPGHHHAGRITLGAYTVRQFDGDTLTVGCHTIPFAEVANVAQQLNLA